MGLSGLSGLRGLSGLVGTGAVAGPSSLLTSLVAYWKMEEASGTRIDATGRGNDLTDNNTVGQVVGRVGFGADFVSANLEYLSKASSADVQMGDNEITFAWWIKPTTSLPLNMVIKNDSDADGGYSFIKGAGTTVYVEVRNIANTSWSSLQSAASMTVSAWNLVVIWHDPTLDTLNVQINNGAVTSQAWSGGGRENSGGLKMGLHTPSGGYLNAVMDEAGIWKSVAGGGGVLTSSQRTSLYNSGNGISYPFTGTP